MHTKAALAALAKMDEETKRIRQSVAKPPDKPMPVSSSTRPTATVVATTTVSGGNAGDAAAGAGVLCLTLGELWMPAPRRVLLDVRRASVIMEHFATTTMPQASTMSLISELAEKKRRVNVIQPLTYSPSLIKLVCELVYDEFDVTRLIQSRCLAKTAFAVSQTWEEICSSGRIGDVWTIDHALDSRLLQRLTDLSAAVTLPGCLKYIVAAMMCDCNPYVHLRCMATGDVVACIPFMVDTYMCFLPVELDWLDHFECCVFGGRVQEAGAVRGTVMCPLVHATTAAASAAAAAATIDPIGQLYLQLTFARRPSMYLQRSNYTFRVEDLNREQLVATATTMPSSQCELLVYLLLVTELCEVSAAGIATILAQRKAVGRRMWHPFLRVTPEPFALMAQAAPPPPPPPPPMRQRTPNPDTDNLLVCLADAAAAAAPALDPTVPLKRAPKRRKIV